MKPGQKTDDEMLSNGNYYENVSQLPFKCRSNGEFLLKT